MTEDERYKQLQNEKQTALNEANQTYDNLLRENTALSNNVNDYLNQYQTTQSGIYDSQLQREQEKADLGKKKAEEEFNKEAIASKNAYYDFANPYGVQRELQVQQGLGNSGYSETVKSQAWTAQQNRTAQARATMNQAKLQFDEDMKDARLNNDVLKAQLALDTLKMKQDETLRNFNYRSDIMQTRLANAQNLSNEYNNRYNTIWNQINTENQQKEAARQFNEKMAYQRERDKVADSQWEREYALSKARTYGSGGYGGSGGSSNPYLSLTENEEQEITNNKINPILNPLEAVKNAISQIDNNKVLKPLQTLYSDKVLSPSARSFYNTRILDSNGYTKGYTRAELYNLLNEAYDNKTLSKKDVKAISDLYGV